MTEPARPQPDPILRRIIGALLLLLAFLVASTTPAHPNGATLLAAILGATGLLLLRRDLRP